jgi:hypothetical protein
MGARCKMNKLIIPLLMLLIIPFVYSERDIEFDTIDRCINVSFQVTPKYSTDPSHSFVNCTSENSLWLCPCTDKNYTAIMRLTNATNNLFYITIKEWYYLNLSDGRTLKKQSVTHSSILAKKRIDVMATTTTTTTTISNVTTTTLLNIDVNDNGEIITPIINMTVDKRPFLKEWHYWLIGAILALILGLVIFNLLYSDMYR